MLQGVLIQAGPMLLPSNSLKRLIVRYMLSSADINNIIAFAVSPKFLQQLVLCAWSTEAMVLRLSDALDSADALPMSALCLFSAMAAALTVKLAKKNQHPQFLSVHWPRIEAIAG